MNIILADNSKFNFIDYISEVMLREVPAKSTASLSHEEEEPDEHELKIRKDREAKMDEHQRIVHEAEEKEKAEREAQVMLERERFCFLHDSSADNLLFSFYLKHMKPQYETWSANKIMTVKVVGLIETNSFPNAKFKVARGSTSQVHVFTLVDLPCMNPYDSILLYNMLLRDKQNYKPDVSL
ncbi:unnamed protein product [Lactuca saligna]|uniref:Uncharacterized protein n=1 Tax=Lactuca saligna TaxID=75948 RepID=A0AA35Y7C0_LACSI|nr:unnamed protein product [Lactuca saligna]